ncbi:MAG: hypothetical protein L3J74_14065 [Bacteroidales bacterium]|nr:hypothetical protein [Bacteroidales bacterium]
MIKKGISIVLLFLYLMVNFMPYIPYIYAASHNHKTHNNSYKEIVSSCSSVNTGDVCYLKAITKRSNQKQETNKPQIIIVNNLEFTPLCTKINIQTFLIKDFEFIEYKANLVNHIEQPNSPPPKYLT